MIRSANEAAGGRISRQLVNLDKPVGVTPSEPYFDPYQYLLKREQFVHGSQPSIDVQILV